MDVNRGGVNARPCRHIAPSLFSYINYVCQTRSNKTSKARHTKQAWNADSYRVPRGRRTAGAHDLTRAEKGDEDNLHCRLLRIPAASIDQFISDETFHQLP
jgi:hypothetical protein